MARSLARTVVAVVVLASCAGGPRAAVRDAVDAQNVDAALEAYARLEATDGADVDALASIAALVLEKEAVSGDAGTVRAVFVELELAGTKGHDVLRRLAHTDGEQTRALALRSLARRGDRGAAAELLEWIDAEDPLLRAAAVGALGEGETQRLVRALDDVAAEVREAAAGALASGAVAPSAREALATVSRGDPEPSVRAAATRALGRAGTGEVAFLEGRLADADLRVRLAAVGALASAGTEEARGALVGLLGAPASEASIEAARHLARNADPIADDARAFLLSALTSAPVHLRTQAAIALESLGTSETARAALETALRGETDAGARLAFAAALGPAHEAARVALREIAAGDDMIALQAAIALAVARDEGAVAALERFVRADDAHLRATAARALARDAFAPSKVRDALRDPVAIVRVRAAGGILAAAAAS